MRKFPISTVIQVAWWLVLGLLLFSLPSAVGRFGVDWRMIAGLAGLSVLLGIARRFIRRWVWPSTVLEINLEQGVVELPPPPGPARWQMRPVAVMREVIDALELARKNPRIVGLVARIGPCRMSMGHAEELRGAVKRLRASGKQCVAWCQTLGEGQVGTVEYYLASAFDEVHLQPLGEVNFVGLLAQQPFIRQTLDKLGVKPQLDHRRQYKNAKYLFTESAMPDPQRESIEGLLSNAADHMVREIAVDRNLDEAQVRERMNRGPWLGEAAKEAGLIDGICFQHELYDRLKSEVGPKLLYVHRYRAKAGGAYRKGAPVALIYGVGPVVRGRSQRRRFSAGMIMGADDVIRAFGRAIESKKTKAIIFRVESPGGSAVASEAIWRAVRRAEEAGKPVIVSMVNVAGSGGYYIAAGARRIVALPTTLTGSIGVVSGKLVTREAWRKIGVEWGAVAVGEHAGLWSDKQEFSESGWQRLQESLDHVYERFKQRVADGRKLEPDAVEAAAQGRVWTGRQAMERGLVDKLGGLHEAIEAARRAVDLPEEAPVQLATIVPRRGLLERLRPADNSEQGASASIFEALVGGSLPPFEPLRELVDWMELEQAGPLTMPVDLAKGLRG